MSSALATPAEGLVAARSTREDRLDDLRVAVTSGRIRSTVHTPASSGWEYLTLLQAALENHFSADDRSFFWGCFLREEDALQAARSGRLGAALQACWELRRECLVHSSRLSDAARSLASVYVSAGEAYVQHKLGNDPAAEHLLLHASALEAGLAVESGLAILSVHRLQLAHNLVRIWARQGRREQVVNVVSRFLDYLEFRKDCVGPELASRPDLLECAPESILSCYFDKFCAEVAPLLSSQQEGPGLELFQQLVRHADPATCPGTRFGTQAHAWVRCRALLLQDEIDAFLAAAAEVLAAGRGTEPNLWCATLNDAVRVCSCLGAAGRGLAKWLEQATCLC